MNERLQIRKAREREICTVIVFNIMIIIIMIINLSVMRNKFREERPIPHRFPDGCQLGGNVWRREMRKMRKMRRWE